jgi:GR25 family glycosyltransferase involved in LPS biosynthesis
MLGSASSHKALWERAAAGRRPIIIIEDDAVLRLDICTALTTVIRGIGGFWDILLLGFNTDAVVAARLANKIVGSTTFPDYPSAEYLGQFRLSTEASAPARLINAFGTCGYARRTN